MAGDEHEALRCIESAALAATSVVDNFSGRLTVSAAFRLTTVACENLVAAAAFAIADSFITRFDRLNVSTAELGLRAAKRIGEREGRSLCRASRT